MSWGIEITNNSGSVLIDGQRQNYAYAGTVIATRQSGPNYSGSTVPGYTHKTAVITAVTRPVLAMNPIEQSVGSLRACFYSYGMAIEAIIPEGGGWVCYLTCGTQVGDVTLDLFVDVQTLGSSSGYGMQVFGPTGLLCFDSDKAPAVFKGSQSVALDSVLNGGYFSLPMVTVPAYGNRVFFSGACAGILFPAYNGNNGSGAMVAPMVVRTNGSYVFSWLTKGAYIFSLDQLWTLASNYGIQYISAPGQLRHTAIFFDV